MLEDWFTFLYISVLTLKLYTLIKADMSVFGDQWKDIAVVSLPAMTLLMEYSLVPKVSMHAHRPSVHIVDLIMQFFLISKVAANVYPNAKAIFSYIRARTLLAPSVY